MIYYQNNHNHIVKLHVFRDTKYCISKIKPHNVNHKTFLENMRLEWDSDVIIIDLVLLLI